MGKYVALRPLRLGPDAVAEEGAVVDTSQWGDVTTEKFVMAGDIMYVPAKDEEYNGPVPLHPFAQYGAPLEYGDTKPKQVTKTTTQEGADEGGEPPAAPPSQPAPAKKATKRAKRTTS